MRNATSTIVMLAVIKACAGWAMTCLGQEFKRGDAVVALRYADLKAGRETVGKVQKGEKVNVEQVQDKWLWVHSGETRGWIDSRSVISSALLAWYQHEHDMTSAPPALWDYRPRVDELGRGRVKAFGVTFDVHSLTPGVELPMSGQIARSIIVNGEKRPSWCRVAFGDLAVTLTKASAKSGERRCTLSINRKRYYGTIGESDHVLIDPSRKVYVNGELRRPR